MKERYQLFNGDCVEETKKLPDASIDFSIFSPPFAELYVYSDDIRDMGNCKNYEEFFQHFSFLTPELYRVLKPGRLVAVHCMDLAIQKGKEGYIGLRDFSGMLIKNFCDNGFIYHDRITIWKSPVVEMQRTKALGLLHKQLKKDSTMSRTGTPDYLLIFRKDGVNEVPVTNTDVPVNFWQEWASPVWYNIDYGDTLNRSGAKEENDEKHLAPLQLQTIERAITLWSNPGDVVFTPFGGIGSEAYQALKMDRKAILIELKKSYFKMAELNCKNVMENKNQILLFQEVA